MEKAYLNQHYEGILFKQWIDLYKVDENFMSDRLNYRNEIEMTKRGQNKQEKKEKQEEYKSKIKMEDVYLVCILKKKIKRYSRLK